MAGESSSLAPLLLSSDVQYPVRLCPRQGPERKRQLTTVHSHQRSLDRFVLVAWCGEGVPESRKGLFRELM